MHGSYRGWGDVMADGPFKSGLGWRPTYAGVRPVDNRWLANIPERSSQNS